jgi:succinate-acetate transporter protein
MVDATVLFATAHVIGCAVVIPGLVTWAIILRSRRQTGIAVLMLLCGVLFTYLLVSAMDRNQFDVGRRGYLGVSASVLSVVTALAVVTTLRREIKMHWDSARQKKGEDCNGATPRDRRSLIRR